ncbi:Reverse transcriptase domain [Trinorchestia longiramus]|nr:Reverse transcriptase domain [Trinorchestia longiramus]
MIFLPKPNTSQKSVQNYRSIFLLDVRGKLLDKILNRRITNYITIHDHYNIRQHGFRQYRGTHPAITLPETITINLAQKHTIDIVLRDVSKAFDRIWHSGLIYKLTQTNLPPLFTKTLNDYLTERTASIRADTYSYTGPLFTLHTGVPVTNTLQLLYTRFTAPIT